MMVKVQLIVTKIMILKGKHIDCVRNGNKQVFREQLDDDDYCFRDVILIEESDDDVDQVHEV